jgi:hypothetical protein
VATYQNHTDVEKSVASEASSLAALYRDVTAYPEPQRTQLKDLLREYTRYVIEEAWPLQREGIVPAGGVKRVAAFQERLVLFEPQTKAQEALHDAALRQFNTFFEYRRTRLYSVNSGIPALLWYTVAVGALINMILIWLFNIRLGAHLLLGGVISFFLATMISLIALMDHPFRGEVGVSSVPIGLRSTDEGISAPFPLSQRRCFGARCSPTRCYLAASPLCLLLAQSGHASSSAECLLSGVKRT